MLIDTHCHLDFPEFDKDRSLIIEKAKAAGVTRIINVGATLQSSQRAVQLAEQYPDIFATVGIHPHDAKECQEGALGTIKKLLENRKVVAIGEVGLDYFRNLSPRPVQEEVFEIFIALAIEKRLPLIVHSRNALLETLALLKANAEIKNSGVVFHCFSGDIDFLKKCLDEGYFVSFTGNVTYPKSSLLKEVVRFVPLKRMFLETDAPYLAPGNRRGERNVPAYLAELAQEIANLKNEPFDKICFETTKNAMKFFHLPIE